MDARIDVVAEVVGETRRDTALDGIGSGLVGIVSAAFGLDQGAVRSRRRDATVSFARQVAMYLGHTRLGLSYAAAGRLFGRDRTTARHACRQVEDRREDPRVDGLLDCLERALDLSVDLARLGRDR
jgi:chromosomal replication initiation ATPase DnaA